MTFQLSKTKKTLVLSFLTFALIAMFFYSAVRIFLFIQGDFYWYETILALLLLSSEGFVIVHSIGYVLNIMRVINYASGYKIPFEQPTLSSYPPVVVVVASYKEPLPVLRDTLICFYNLSYPNKYLYLLDDTRYDLAWDSPENKLKYRISIEELCSELEINLFRAKWHGAKAGMLNDFLAFIHGEQKEGFEYTAYSKNQPTEPPKYLIIFDADMNPIPDFVEYVVDLMEKNSRLAFVQTPQYYTNFQFNRVARGSGLQQAIFYEYICDGRSLRNAMFCCGTNVILRIEALRDVGGFNELSIVEDFATSVKFHQKGWHSVYLNRVSSFGMGPEDLRGFFKQQFRWAQGTLAIYKLLLKDFFLRFNKFTISQWWEYFLSSTHYLIGLVYFIMVILPVIYIFFDIPSFLSDPVIYLLSFSPYILLTMFMFVWTLKQRKYRTIDIVSVLLLNAVTFPIFIRAAFYAFFGIKASFGVTPKTGYTILPLTAFTMQITCALLSVMAVIWGTQRIYYEGEPLYGLLLNMSWCLYNFFMISSFLYYNHTEESVSK